MSKNRTRTISCQRCGKSFDVLIWDSLNADTDPEQREEIKKGTFNRYKCPDCGFTMILQYSCLYTDMSHAKQVFVIPTDFDKRLEEANRYFDLLEKKELQTVADIADNCSFRAVHDFSELREKVNMWDNGFDDTAMELYKAMTRAWLETREDGGKPVSKAFFSSENGKDEIEILFEDGSAGAVDFVPDLYRDITAKYSDDLNSALKSRCFNVVDFDFAANYMSGAVTENNPDSEIVEGTFT